MDINKLNYLYYKKKYLTLKKQNTKLLQNGGSNSTNNKNKKIDVVLFKAEWCGYCTKFKPTWDIINNKYNSKYNFITYDADINKNEVNKFKVNGFPSIFFRDNTIVKQYEGARDLETLENILTNMVKI
jgi:thiol-disulfide isomerase/thioredoxin